MPRPNRSSSYADGTYDAGVLYRKPGIKLLVDFITNPAFMATGNVERLQRLHDDIKGKDWFMALLDIEEYIQTKERVLADSRTRTPGCARRSSISPTPAPSRLTARSPSTTTRFGT